MTTILTVQEVAEHMRCEHRTVRRAIRSGELEAALIGGKWLVREDAVEEWFRSRCAVPNPFALSPRAGRPRNDSRRPEATGSVERLRAIEHGGA
jgi:excisionase family DNA binding protein